MKNRWFVLLAAMVIVSLFSVSLVGRQTTAARATLEGVVLDAATGEPISGVVLQGPMESPSLVPGLARGPLEERRPQATTGQDGRFLLTNLSSGRIAVNILKPGYVPRTITASLSAGLRTQGVVARLTATGTLSGRVFDGSGKPAADLLVTLLGFINSAGHRELRKRGQAISNDRGEFRFPELEPDRYIVALEPPRPPAPELEWRRPETGILYPGVDSVTKADVIAVRSRENTRLNDITFPARTPLGEVRVRMNYDAGEPVRDIAYWFMSRTRSQFISDGRSIGSTPVMPTGIIVCGEGKPRCERGLTLQRFEAGESLEKTFWPTLPGSYEVGARWEDANGELRQVIEPVEFHGDDLNVVLMLARPEGQVEMRVVHEEADGTAKPLLDNANISLCRSPSGCLGPLQQSLSLQLSKGSARAESVAPGRYFVIYANGPPDTHVVSIRQGSRDVLREGVLISKSAEAIEMQVKSGRPVLRGKVIDPQGRGVADALVGVLPGPSLDEMHLLNLRRTLRTDHEGWFELSGILPGAYSVYAWASATESVLVEPDFATTFKIRGTTVTVAASGQSAVGLTILDERPKDFDR